MDHLYSSCNELLEREHLDSIHILTPPPAHTVAAVDSLNHFCHCLIEKPLTTSLQEAEQLGNAAEENKRTVGVNHNKIWNPAFSQVLTLINQGRLGEIKHVSVEHAVNRPLRNGDWTLDNPAFPVFETAPHAFSMIRNLLGPVEQVQNRLCGTVEFEGKNFISSWQSIMECRMGNAFAFVSLHNPAPSCTVSISGTEGTAQADLLSNTVIQSSPMSRFEPFELVLKTVYDGTSLLKQSVRSGASHVAQRFGHRSFGDPFLESMRRSIGEFYDALRDGREPKASLAAGRDVVGLCEQVASDLQSELERGRG